MKRIFYKALIAFAAAATLSIGCKKDNGGGGNVSLLTLDKTELVLAPGEFVTLVATVTPANTEVKWESNDISIASINSEGKVIAKAIGEAEITATAGNKKAKCTVKVYPEENPLAAYLKNTGFDQNVFNGDGLGLSLELGLLFTPQVTGKITAVTFKIPDSRTNVRVTLWDAATQAVLKTITIPSASKDVEVKQLLDAPLLLTKNKQYAITFNTGGKYYYYHQRTNSTEATYPVQAGKIQIDNYASVVGSNQIFPTNVIKNVTAGDCSFVFQQTE